MKKLILILFLSAILSEDAPAQRTEHLFIVVIDGARYTETFGDPAHLYIPKIWNYLRPLGAVYTSFYNDGLTQTNPGHASILTGTWQSIDNAGAERPHMPTLFEYRRKETSSPMDENYVVLGKDKLGILSYSDHPDYGSLYGASVEISASQYDDVYTFGNIKHLLSASHPRLLIANFAGTDRAGHDGPWENYTSKIRRADSLVFEIWNLIQSDSTYRDKTTMILTGDHGRHLDGIADGYRGHGDGCDGCRHVATLIIGPDTPAGIVDSTRWDQTDIGPTVGCLLNFCTPLSTGTVMHTALTPPLLRFYSVTEGWNLLSVPSPGAVMNLEALFPAAISNAYAYDSNYTVREKLEVGAGYWLKFGTSQEIPLTGREIRSDTIALRAGWNLIGSLSVPISAADIGVSQPDVTIGNFYYHTDRYLPADTLRPFRGYWVKAHADCLIYLNSDGPPAGASRIRIADNGELPPPAPHNENATGAGSGVILDQNFPNPFNPLTTISFYIPSSQKVTLKIYDMLGREVSKLIDGEGRSEGRHELKFDASNLSAGTYICGMHTGNSTYFMKILLIK